MPKVRRVMLRGFVANFTGFPAVHKFWKSVKIWQSYREFKGGNFFWDTVYVSKTTLILHTITSTHIKRFWQFWTELLLKEYAIKRWLVIPPLLTNVSALPGETWTWTPEIVSFQSCCIPCLENDPALACYIFDIQRSANRKPIDGLLSDLL